MKSRSCRGLSLSARADGGCDDRGTIWAKTGLGGSMPTDGMEGGELIDIIDLLSIFSSADQWQTKALVFII